MANADKMTDILVAAVIGVTFASVAQTQITDGDLLNGTFVGTAAASIIGLVAFFIVLAVIRMASKAR